MHIYCGFLQAVPSGDSVVLVLTEKVVTIIIASSLFIILLYLNPFSCQQGHPEMDLTLSGNFFLFSVTL